MDKETNKIEGSKVDLQDVINDFIKQLPKDKTLSFTKSKKDYEKMNIETLKNLVISAIKKEHKIMLDQALDIVNNLNSDNVIKDEVKKFYIFNLLKHKKFNQDYELSERIKNEAHRVTAS